MGSPARPGTDSLRRFLAARGDQGRTPGATWWVGSPGRSPSHGAVGRVAEGDGADRVAEATPFDLASLTKPLATATLLVLLEQGGVLDLEAPLGAVLDEAAPSPLASCPLVSLAAHTAGLAPWAPLFLGASDLDGYVAQILARPLATEPHRASYSDLGYLLLGAVLERASGRRLDQLFDERIARPLGLDRIGFATEGRVPADAAATERGNRYERAMAGEAGRRHAWREEIPRGEVHDANAHALGGVAGHAGLFGTAAEVARIAAEWLRPEFLQLGDAARRRLLWADPTRDGRTVGLVTAACSPAARGVLPASAPGHTGFTGTSLWVDPEAERVFVLLTNRVHPRVPARGFHPVRRAFHRLAARGFGRTR